ncbi:MAG TPA: radical SAM protein [Anaerolineales bacterium]|nr:radical SAM protein [Anaerolineales bacterium]
MDQITQLSLLSQDMHFEPDASREEVCRTVVRGREVDIPISELQMPGGKRMKVLKTLLTSACERNCYYCPFRAGRDMRRATFKPEEMASVFMGMHRAKMVEGLFLSSGIAGGSVRTQDRLIDTADILRNKYKYRGYLHLKLMPGVEKDQVERAMELASRLSVNLEAPNAQRLEALAPKKAFTEELVDPLKWAEQIRRDKSPHRSWNGRWPSTVTQFVVGAAGETDVELLSTSEQLYDQARLGRVHYSAFSPVPDTPLENLPAEDPLRQHRLYQSSFLLRDYGYTLEDLPFAGDGNLPLDADPKRAWAEAHLAEVPVELNTAGREALLRVPGIGPRAVEVLLKNRLGNKVTTLGDLQKLGIKTKGMAPFVLLDGRRPVRQMALFK